MKFNKKAALELSINAIVIVILAMTLLGLGLGFVRNMFKDISGTTGQVQEQMREQITEQLRTGEKPLAFPTSEISLGKKESRNLAVGVKNTQQGEKEFRIRVFAVNDTTGTRFECPSDGIIPNTNPAKTCIQYEPFTDEYSGTFVYNKGGFSLAVNQDHIMPIKFTAGSATGTTVYEIEVQLGETGTTPGVVWHPYDKKSFFITIT